MTASKKMIVLLMGVLVIVVLMRFISIFQGLPFSSITDEVGGVAGTLLMASRKSLQANPDGAYTSLYNNSLAVIYGLLYVIGKLFGVFQDKYDFALRYMTDPWLFYFTARAYTFITGVGALWFTWKCGRVLTGSQIGGVLSALILGMSMIHMILSMQGKVDSLMVFFVSAYLYQVVRVLKEQTGLRECVIAGLFFGLAVATKMNAVLLAPALPLALLIRKRENLNRQAVLNTVKYSCIFGMCSGIFFLLGNPQFLVSPRVAWLAVTAQSKANQFVVFSKGETPTRWVWVFHDLISVEGVIGALLIVSLAYSVFLIFRRKRLELLLPLLFIVGYIAYVGNSTRAALHYLLPVYPLFAVVTAVMLSDLIENSAVKSSLRTLGILAVVALITGGLWKNADYIMTNSKVSTRIAAKNWMEHNIPNGTLIAYDDYAASPPFFSPDVYLNSGAKLGYEKYVPVQLKQKLVEYAEKHTSYRSMRLRRYVDTPQFPDSWSAEYRRNLENDTTITHYYRLVFESLEGMYQKKVDYIVVCEGYYKQFFSINYKPDNPLYAYQQTAASLYRQLLGTNPYYYKIAEFMPTSDLSGERIIIYKKRNTL